MAPIIQPVIDLIGLVAAVVLIALTATCISGLLVRQLRWFGYGGFEREVQD